MSFFSLVYRELSLVCLFEVFSKTSIFIWILALARSTSASISDHLSVAARDG